MSTIALRVALVREIEQSMRRIDHWPEGFEEGTGTYQDGQLDAYSHMLMLLKDEDL